MIEIGLQRRIKKFVSRIIESRWTRYFIITSILQAALVITLEIRVLLRNDDSSRNAQSYMEATNLTLEDHGCTIKPSLFRMNNIEEENAIFIIFQIFQMWFCFTAVYNQNTIQIITLSIINYLCASFSLVQVFEVKKWYSDLVIACPGQFDNLDPYFCYYDVPLVIVLLFFATIMAFLSWKLYRQFGWNIYRKIGADIKIQSMYKTMHIFVMLLKLDLFFIQLLCLEGCTVYLVNIGRNRPTTPDHMRYIPKPVFLFHICVTVLVGFTQLLAYRSLRKEYKIGMIIVAILWVVFCVDLIIITKYSIRTVQDSWFFFIIFLFFGVIMCMLSFIWTIFVLKNFGQGLQTHGKFFMVF
ncbi:hypothetical protein C2G38_596441 [Gigaspora rosea]|uniref:Uncharacterized protein n=1 Tax=Gigaspora rosea TaxID=44941 RepID=A0A397U9L8_9GLOM|nr:hypothetical protein C2G38_596441 [Gigaspora rosea]